MNAIIEIGTNSLKLLIYQKQPNFKSYLDKTIISRISEGFNQSGGISLHPLQRNILEIKKALQIARDYNCESIRLVGTMIFREANNSQEVIEKINQACNLKLRVLSGQEEAYYSFIANTALLTKSGEVLVIDSGGGSTEFILGNKSRIHYSKSVDIGAVNLTQEYNLDNQVDERSFIATNDKIKRELDKVSLPKRAGLLLGLGGSITTISAIIQKLAVYDPKKVQNSIIKLECIENLSSQLVQMNLEERRKIIGLAPKRADIILGGVMIVTQIMKKFNFSSLMVSERGLRYGLAIE